ncbi:hypothetical protein AS594_39545 [Streptomyces agglomeratus]|uniref:Uncharacterized protein n=1 Tax=Streptomyces agglomeratus TaxID=285458 RepID=A0A1E5NZ82_9ACTN|nr:hypothetical protein AS594_39545 [Streptomyces agglomeratus]
MGDPDNTALVPLAVDAHVPQGEHADALLVAEIVRWAVVLASGGMDAHVLSFHGDSDPAAAPAGPNVSDGQRLIRPARLQDSPL